MSAGADGGRARDLDHGTATIDPSGPATEAPDDEDHHVLLEPEEDRWRWRRKIRQHPRQLAFYRFGVALAGLFFICLGCISGPIPGPGGIPLVLLGLAIWSSEFEWANRLMGWFKTQLKRYQGWSRGRRVLFWVAFFVICGSIGYGYMLILGVPGWLPGFVEKTLLRLPGL